MLYVDLHVLIQIVVGYVACLQENSIYIID